MKNLDSLKLILIEELERYIFNVELFKNLEYYNKQTGDLSATLSAILDIKLKKNNNWDFEMNWIDDCLITKIEDNKEKCMIWGVMIWGKRNTTEQWTDPFYFEMEKINSYNNKEKMNLLFGDLNMDSVNYTNFNNNRGAWDIQFYSNQDWDVRERKWKFALYDI